MTARTGKPHQNHAQETHQLTNPAAQPLSRHTHHAPLIQLRCLQPRLLHTKDTLHTLCQHTAVMDPATDPTLFSPSTARCGS